jgi:hypothetical protein
VGTLGSSLTCTYASSLSGPAGTIRPLATRCNDPTFPCRFRRLRSCPLEGRSGRASVVHVSNCPRTQSGHIRNDTRDVSRRIPVGRNRPICGRKCVASERACTRVTHPNFHGKEGVDGSSPSEGLPKNPANRHIVMPLMARFRDFAGTRRVHFGTGGHLQARATSRDAEWNADESGDRDDGFGKFLQADVWCCPWWRQADHLLR